MPEFATNADAQGETRVQRVEKPPIREKVMEPNHRRSQLGLHQQCRWRCPLLSSAHTGKQCEKHEADE